MAGSRYEIALASGDAPHAAEAAARTMRDCPGLRIDIDETRVFLETPDHLGDAVHRWRIALVNERLLASGAAVRRELVGRMIA